MPDQLIVLLGAGASYDATNTPPVSTDWRPPLVTELFATRTGFTTILERYPGAQSLAPDLRAASASGAIGLETYLREHVLNSGSEYDRRRYGSIPLYFQDLLHEVSRVFTPHPVNTDILINALNRTASHTLFLTLNYDTILDRRLALHSPIDHLDHYIRPDAPWGLVKLHGSINWMREIRATIERDYYLTRAGDLFASGSLDLADEITLIERTDVAATRRPADRDDRLYFPRCPCR